MKPARWVGIALVAALGLTLAINLNWIARHLGALRPVAGGAAAPGFALALYHGGEYRLAPGHVTVIDFWASWCPPCRAELPTLAALDRRYRDHGVDVVAVNVEAAEELPTVIAFLDRQQLDLRFALGGGAVAERYHVESLPHLVVVDGAGRVRSVLIGPAPEEDLVAAIEAARN